MTNLLHHQIALQLAACHDDLSSRETKDHMSSDFGKNSEAMEENGTDSGQKTKLNESRNQ